MKFARKTDLLVLAAIVVVALLAFLFYRQSAQGKTVKAEIYCGSELVETVALDRGEERVFSVPQRDGVLFHLYPDGSIAFEASDCPDQVCVRAGRLKLAGASAACLPNELILKLVPVGERAADDLDMIAH